MNERIPVMHCFNDNYTIPAGVAFYSMLKYANPDYQYDFFVLHTDITEENRDKLLQTVGKFPNGSLKFIDMKNRFDDLFTSTKAKGHFSKEMFYKFLAPSIFPNLDKIIITDVDVVYLGDIAESFNAFKKESDYYAAMIKEPILNCPSIKRFKERTYGKRFTQEERAKLLGCAGYMIFDLKKMREDSMEEKMISYARRHAHRLALPEQDTINLLCHPKVFWMPLKDLVCTNFYERYNTDEDFQNDIFYSEDEIRYAMGNPVQLHYAGPVKPWNDMSCTKSEEWFKLLPQTPFLKDFLLSQKPKLKAKKLFEASLPISSKRFLKLRLDKVKKLV